MQTSFSNSLIFLSDLRREKWKQRQEEKRILEEIFMEHQKMTKEMEEVDEKKFSYGACVAEGCIISKY